MLWLLSPKERGERKRKKKLKQRGTKKKKKAFKFKKKSRRGAENLKILTKPEKGDKYWADLTHGGLRKDDRKWEYWSSSRR